MGIRHTPAAPPSHRRPLIAAAARLSRIARAGAELVALLWHKLRGTPPAAAPRQPAAQLTPRRQRQLEKQRRKAAWRKTHPGHRRKVA